MSKKKTGNAAYSGVQKDESRDAACYPALCRLRPQSRLLSGEEMVTISQAEWEKLQKKLARLETERNTARKQKKAAEERIAQLEAERSAAKRRQEAAEQRVIKLSAEQRETQQGFQNFREESRTQKRELLDIRIITAFGLLVVCLACLIFMESSLEYLAMVAIPLFILYFWMTDAGRSGRIAQYLTETCQILCLVGCLVCAFLWAIWGWDWVIPAEVSISAGAFLIEGVWACIQRRSKR